MKLFPGWTIFPEGRGNSFVRLCCHRSVTFSGQPVRSISLLRVLARLSDLLNPTYSSVGIPGWVQSGRLARSPFTCTRGRQSMSLRRSGNWLCAGLPAASSFLRSGFIIREPNGTPSSSMQPTPINGKSSAGLKMLSDGFLRR